MESWEAIAISQALRLGQFWHACNMPLTAHRHVNGKPLKIGINWRKFVPFHPLDLQKTELFHGVSPSACAAALHGKPEMKEQRIIAAGTGLGAVEFFVKGVLECDARVEPRPAGRRTDP